MNVRPIAAAAALILATGLLAACGGSTSGAPSGGAGSAAATSQPAPDGALTVTDPWVKATDTEMTGAFGVIANPGDSDVTVVSAATSASGMTELHETVMKDGQMVMQPKEGGFVVPTGGELVLEPGGNHVMLMGVPKPIEPGDEVAVTLTLDDGGTVEFTAVAKEFTGAQESYRPSPSTSM